MRRLYSEIMKQQSFPMFGKRFCLRNSHPEVGCVKNRGEDDSDHDDDSDILFAHDGWIVPAY